MKNLTEIIENYNNELDRLNEMEDCGDLDMEDFENELKNLLMTSLQDYFGGKYTELNGKSLRIADHQQGTVYNSKSDFSFCVVTFSKQNQGVDYSILYNTDIEEAINYINETVK